MALIGDTAQRTGEGSRRARVSSTAGLLPPLALGLAAAVVSYAAAWVPNYWSDEVATVRAASLSPSTLIEFLQHKDAVHGFYYLLIHFWSLVFGTGEASLRAPSALAVGVAAAGLVLLGRQLGRPRLGLIAAVVFAVLPRTTYMGAEARSYALTAAAAVILTVLLLWALKRGGLAPWILYGVVAALSVLLFVYVAFLAVVHLIVLLAWRREHAADRLRLTRSRCVGFVGAWLAVVVVLSPFLLLAVTQKGQIAWLAASPVLNPWTALVQPWFEASAVVGIVGWLFLLASIVRWRRILAATGPLPLAIALAWVVVPTVLLLLVNIPFGPLFTARYLSFADPGMALLLAAAICGLGSGSLTGSGLGPASGGASVSGVVSPLGQASVSGVVSPSGLAASVSGVVSGRDLVPRPGLRSLLGQPRLIALALLIVLVIPNYVAQRGEFAKNGGSNLRQVAETVRVAAHPGQGILFAASSRGSLNPRLALYGYPADFAGLVDVALRKSFPATQNFSDSVLPLTSPALTSRLASLSDVQLVVPSPTVACSATPAGALLVAQGFALASRSPLHENAVCIYRR
jgi:mannosyltransferase